MGIYGYLCGIFIVKLIMSSDIQNNNTRPPISAAHRVAMNTGILYVKMLLTMGISLYSTRLVLNALGASDFGIFSLIASVIAMLSFLKTAMATSTQRFLSYHQGSKDLDMQKKVFTNSWVLHIAIGLVIILFLLVLQPFFFGGFLNIPEDRIFVAKTVYYFMLVSVFFTTISAPFSATLTARENMLWVAIVNGFGTVLRLFIALSLSYFIQNERLAIFGLLTAGVSVASFLLYALVCLKKYPECSVKSYRVDKLLIKELASFSVWMLFRILTYVGRAQGLAVILNIFYGAVLNAAYGIAHQLSGQLSVLSEIMLKALNPQIMKSEGLNDRRRMLRLSMMASKFGFFLVTVIAIPAIFEMPTILGLWLKNVPPYTDIFCSLILVLIMTSQLTVGLESAIQATGKIRTYQLIVGGILLLNVPMAYLLLNLSFPPYSILLSAIALELISCAVRLLFVKKVAGLSIKEYTEKVLLREIIPILTIILLCWIITNNFLFSFRFLMTGFISTVGFAISIYYVGLCNDEKLLINNMLKNIKHKIYQSK